MMKVAIALGTALSLFTLNTGQSKANHFYNQIDCNQAIRDMRIGISADFSPEFIQEEDVRHPWRQEQRVQHLKKLIVDECRNTKGFTSLEGSCIIANTSGNCFTRLSYDHKVRSQMVRKKRYVPKYLDWKYYGGIVARGLAIPVKVTSATAAKKDGGEMRVTISVEIDPFSEWKQPPLQRRSTALIALDKSGLRNLARQCERGAYPAGFRDGSTELQGFKQDGRWKRTFSFDTDREKCESGSSLVNIRDRNTGELTVIAERTINTGDFQTSSEDAIRSPGQPSYVGELVSGEQGPTMAILSNGYIAAFIQCKLSNGTCITRYPSIFTDLNPRGGHPSYFLPWDYTVKPGEAANSLFAINNWPSSSELPVREQFQLYLNAACKQAVSMLEQNRNTNNKASDRSEIINLAMDCMSGTTVKGKELAAVPTIASLQWGDKTLCEITYPGVVLYKGFGYDTYTKAIPRELGYLGVKQLLPQTQSHCYGAITF